MAPQERSRLPGPEAVRSAEEIGRALDQMLLLAELSASEADLDRETLQRTVERLKDKIDRAADRIEGPIR
ncbi:hypothetical protein D7V91_13510 [bacterium 1xD42-67]|nr:hypothetical protein D7V91_13510 [bacterium 1xD42-67]